MRKFRDAFGFDVDLDDPSLYDKCKIPNTINECESKMFEEIGYAYWYTSFRHKDWYEGNNQGERVNKLIEDFTNNLNENRQNLMWYREQIYLFQDETENMC